MASDLDIIGKRIRELRMQKDMTQAELAAKAYCSTRWIGAIERGQHNVTVHLFLFICRALDCKPSDLLSESPSH